MPNVQIGHLRRHNVQWMWKATSPNYPVPVSQRPQPWLSQRPLKDHSSILLINDLPSGIFFSSSKNRKWMFQEKKCKFLWFPSEHCIQPDVKKPIADAKKKAPLIYMPFVVVVKMGTGEIAYYSQWNPLDLQAPECILYRIWLLDLLFSVFFANSNFWRIFTQIQTVWIC